MSQLALAVDLKDVIYILAAAVGSIGVLAVLGAFIWWKFAGERGKQKSTAAGEWRGIAEGHGKRIEDLDQQVKTWKQAHDQCEAKINKIVQFNLRLQARERSYQRTINRMEIRLQIDPTDFNDINDAPASSDT